uniref:Acetyl-CoA carboxylase n=1 Tax=Tanacetum cinerariifolium TaxID=118510 RepID=A0A699H9D4_TANCI|nr:acetyl-CoA carboxylase [Tanacetum cinerariifolium]
MLLIAMQLYLHGNVAALHSHDCSVQRRHQKIIKEGPITVAPQETIKKLEQAARKLAKSVNYNGVSTIEYLYSMETGDYYFLELNSRLQTIESSPCGEYGDSRDVNLSQLNLIDLAGSESSKAKTTGVHQKEEAYKNKSLLTLGTVRR